MKTGLLLASSEWDQACVLGSPVPRTGPTETTSPSVSDAEGDPARVGISAAELLTP